MTKTAAAKKNAPKTAKPSKTAPVTAPTPSAPKAAKATAQKTEKTPKAKPASIASTVESPVALAHSTCDKMAKANPDLARKDVKAAHAGKVNKHTISTQWQKWNVARRAAK